MMLHVTQFYIWLAPQDIQLFISAIKVFFVCVPTVFPILYNRTPSCKQPLFTLQSSPKPPSCPATSLTSINRCNYDLQMFTIVIASKGGNGAGKENGLVSSSVTILMLLHSKLCNIDRTPVPEYDLVWVSRERLPSCHRNLIWFSNSLFSGGFTTVILVITLLYPSHHYQISIDLV